MARLSLKDALIKLEERGISVKKVGSKYDSTYFLQYTGREVVKWVQDNSERKVIDFEYLKDMDSELLYFIDNMYGKYESDNLQWNSRKQSYGVKKNKPEMKEIWDKLWSKIDIVMPVGVYAGIIWKLSYEERMILYRKLEDFKKKNNIRE